MKRIPRHLAATVEHALTTSRVVSVIGPRQAGKTVLVKEQVRSARYLTLDDRGLMAALESDVYGQLGALSEQARVERQPIVLDEVQRLPEITLALKKIVDEDNRKGQFLLTGSSDIFSSGKSYDSLAGRVMTLVLRPLSSSEILERLPCKLLDAVSSDPKNCLSQIPKLEPYSRNEVIDFIIRGGFPEIRDLNDRDRSARYGSYLDSIVERDVAPVAEVRKPDTLRRLIDQLAVRTANELNIVALCNTLKARRETIVDYLDILSRLSIIHRLGAWTSSGGKREIKASKVHFLDTGCATALRGEDKDSFAAGADPVALGQLLESFFFIELEKSLPHLSKRWRFYHWRQEQKEIDIVAEAPGRLLALFEIKAAASVGADDFRHINWFMSEGPGKSYKGAGFVIYLGKEVLSFGDNRIALPLSILWSYV